MRKAAILLWVLPHLIFSQVTTDEIIDKAISYHDPNGKWDQLKTRLIFTGIRPEGPERFATIDFDNAAAFMKINRNNEEIYEVIGDEAKVVAGGKDEARALMLRNYYLYLWGLPMKLKDKSTPTVQRMNDEEVKGVNCYVVRVAYQSDIWYFHFDMESGRMIQYKFYKDEEAGKGELITLEDEVLVDGIRMPKKRNWYTLPEMKFLGTDILTKSE